MTRAERIRSMTDEELGEWLYPLVAGAEVILFCPGCEACGELLDEGFIPEEMCVGCLVAYLRQEDENERNGEKIHEEAKHPPGSADPGCHGGSCCRDELW